MEWPDICSETYDFVTTPTAKQIWKRAAKAAVADICGDHKELKPVVDAFLKRLNECDDDAFENYEYRSLMQEFTELHARVSNEQSLDMAQAGLDAVHDLLLWRLDARTVVPAKDVFILTKSFKKLGTITLMGTKPPDIEFQFGLANPAAANTVVVEEESSNNPDVFETETEATTKYTTDHYLYGLDAVSQINAWYNYGVLETSASVLAKTTLMNTHLPATLCRKKFVLLGCTSELGPARSLLLIPGVTVLGVARGGKRLDDLLDFVRYNAPDDTTFLYPKSEDYYPNGGADLLIQGPAIAQWVLDQTKEDDEIVLVPLAYSADGEEHVRLVASMDLILQRVLRQRPSTILWSYTSPLTCMVVPPTAATMALQRRNHRPQYEQWANTLTMGKWLEPSLTPDPNNHDYIVLNAALSAQGPNYVLAQTIKQWRCMLTQYREHQHVSAPFCPPTRTASMIVHDKIANCLEGMHHFEPMLAFGSAPASTLMAAIFIAHLQLLNRQVPDLDESPFSMFWDGAVHGGIWTCPYTLESISVINYALGKTTYYPKGYVPPGALPPPRAEGEDSAEEEASKKPIDPNVLLTLCDSQEGKPMPDSVRERLDFL
mmetsp:Transcript_25231/g.41396  ORF Transcript_25231/g.41396 Transcript_25231/m.41396 type:complete len:602 (-) Transcript_25231:370-2175(-)